MQTPQLYTGQLPTSFVVVLLTDLSVHGDVIPEDTVLEVDRGVRNDWIGSRLCRDATAEEIAEFRAEQGAAELISDDIRELARDKGDLEDGVAELKRQHSELTDQVKDLEAKRGTLQGEVDDLGAKQKKLADEVAALEKAKKAAK